MKCVMILDEALSMGLAANTAAALGLSLGNHVPGLIGSDVIDGDGYTHKGITAVPIPVLAAENEVLKGLYMKATHEEKELLVIGFNSTAQRCHTYDVYRVNILQQERDDLHYLGICIYGSKKQVNRLCGQFKLLR